MKSFDLLLLMFLVPANAINPKILQRQNNPQTTAPAKSWGASLLSGLINFVPVRKPASSVIIPSKLRVTTKDSVRKKIRYGPFMLASANDSSTQFLGEKGTSMSNMMIEPPCVDCVVLSGGITIQYADGRPADASAGVYNHHTVIAAIGKPSKLMVCPGQKLSGTPSMPMSTIVGGAADDSKQLYTSEDGEFKSGVILTKGQTFGLTYYLVNYLPIQQEVYAVAEIEYLPTIPKDFLDATTLNISPTSCDKMEFVLEKKVTSLESSNWSVPSDGYILTTQGHMHNGGDSVELILNDKTVCLSKAEYALTDGKSQGHGGEIISTISKCTQPIALKKGDRLKVKTNYDLEKHPTRVTSDKGQIPSVMGFAVLTLAFPPGFVIP